MSPTFLSVVVVILLVWIAILTFLFWQLKDHYNRLTRGVNEKSMKAVLESLLRDNAEAKKDIDYLKNYRDKSC